MGIGLNRTFGNIIGQDAEKLVKTRIKNWLHSQQLILEEFADGTHFPTATRFLDAIRIRTGHTVQA